MIPIKALKRKVIHGWKSLGNNAKDSVKVVKRPNKSAYLLSLELIT